MRRKQRQAFRRRQGAGTGTRRVLAAYRRHGVLDAEAAKDMAAWDHGGGFSVDASVGIAADDRPALERLLR